MPCSDCRARAAPGAVAIVKGDPPQVLLADSAAVMSRLVALHVVAASSPTDFTPDVLEAVRSALLEERWAEAVVTWMAATGTFIDIYEEYVPIWSEWQLTADLAAFEVRLGRIFLS
jgi:hypothetical protein